MEDIKKEFIKNYKNFMNATEKMNKSDVIELTDKLIQESNLTIEEKEEIKKLTFQMLENRN